MMEEQIFEAIHGHFRSLAKRDTEHGVVARIIDEIIDRMADQDMSLQEIASILLPIDHAANSDAGLKRPQADTASLSNETEA